MKAFLHKYFSYSPFVSFLPFAFIYFAVVLLRPTHGGFGDECRYLTFANNLAHGFYSPPPPAINLWSGPGYPIVILIPVWLNLPLITLTLLNAVFQYVSVVFLFKAMTQYTSRKTAIFGTLCWAVYYPGFIWFMPLIYTESLTILLVVLVLFGFGRAFASGDKWDLRKILLLSFFLGFLALTKIIFGHVLVFLWVVSLFYFAVQRSFISKKMLAALSLAFVFTLPYLGYTWSLTGRFLYWGNPGGENLYWMSTPYTGEYGEWHGSEIYDVEHAGNSVLNNHAKELEYIHSLEGVQRDDAYKKIAWENIRLHPGKYARNCLANLSRILFDAPTYFASPTDLFILRILPVCLLLPFILIALFVFTVNFRRLPVEFRFLFLLLLFYFGLSVLVSAYNRQLIIMVPVFLLFIGYTFERFIRVTWGEKDKV